MVTTCPACNQPAFENGDRRFGDYSCIICPTCGEFQIDGLYYAVRKVNPGPIPRLSTILRSMFDSGESIKMLTKCYVNELLTRQWRAVARPVAWF